MNFPPSVLLWTISVLKCIFARRSELPLLPKDLTISPNGTEVVIPKHLWIGFRERPPGSLIPRHIENMTEEAMRSGWIVDYFGDNEMNLFMETYYRGTSLLWAYKMINDDAKVSCSDIWRYAVLYAFGGFYLDDDSFLPIAIAEQLMRTNSTLILSKEGNQYGECYSPQFKLSDACLSKRFNTSRHLKAFDNKYLVNWAMFSTPRHPVMRRILSNIVAVIKSEYNLENALVRRKSWFLPWHAVICSTGPAILTASLRELIAENKNSDWLNSVQVEGMGFGTGVTFKVKDYVAYSSNSSLVGSHYKTVMVQRNSSLLRAYAKHPST